MVKRLSILVVDDDETLLRAWERGIGRQTRLFTARSLSEARTIARKERLDVVIVDFLLGPENGIDLVRELKAQARRPRCKVLLITGYASTEITVTAIRAGADDVRHKPFLPRALLPWLETGRWNESETEPTTPTMERVQWEHARRVVSDCGGNISAAAGILKVERSTLRRHLKKRAPRR